MNKGISQLVENKYLGNEICRWNWEGSVGGIWLSVISEYLLHRWFTKF